MGLPTNTPLSFAPSGDFTIKKIWSKGISGARKYIYIEDQSFWGTEQSDWINAQIKAHDDLKVILLIGRWDPNDQAMSQTEQLQVLSINQHLLAGLSQAQKDRICFASRRDTTIHTKSTICDDAWGAIGSANYMIRSLYTDMESYIGFMEEDGQLVPNYRQSLWDMHFGTVEPDLDRAIDRWFNLSNNPDDLPTKLHRVNLPLPAGNPISADDQRLIDAFLECDSRKNWGLDVARLGLEALNDMDVMSN
jgi:phosphatidylserine/phosphatidylglycerophosphate/cardiolipin synthase-like enzyme